MLSCYGSVIVYGLDDMPDACAHGEVGKDLLYDPVVGEGGEFCRTDRSFIMPFCTMYSIVIRFTK